MKSRLGTLAVLIVALACMAQAAVAAPVKVDVRVEGAKTTLFEKSVTTDGHAIDGHPCDGTNGGANPTPGPTFTAALDDALAGKWSGTFSDQFSDFLVDSILNEKPAQPSFWGLYLNYKFAELGGCQQRIKAGDEVLFAVGNGDEKHELKLTGPKKATVGKAFKLKLVDGATGDAVDGAKVARQTVPASGVVKVKPKKAGKLTFKGRAPASIRSNAVTISVKAAKKQ
jgi:hypothetical protein